MGASYHGYWGPVWCLKLNPHGMNWSRTNKISLNTWISVKPLPITAVQDPKPWRWGLRTMDTGAQCSVVTNPEHLNWYWMNKTSLSTLIYVINHWLQGLYKFPSLEDGGFESWPLGSNVVFEIDTQCLNWRWTSITSLNTYVFFINHCL